MNKSMKKAIFTGSTALAILGAVFVPVSGADAATFYNGYNNPVRDMYKLDRDDVSTRKGYVSRWEYISTRKGYVSHTKG